MSEQAVVQATVEAPSLSVVLSVKLGLPILKRFLLSDVATALENGCSVETTIDLLLESVGEQVRKSGIGSLERPHRIDYSQVPGGHRSALEKWHEKIEVLFSTDGDNEFEVKVSHEIDRHTLSWITAKSVAQGDIDNLAEADSKIILWHAMNLLADRGEEAVEDIEGVDDDAFAIAYSRVQDLFPHPFLRIHLSANPEMSAMDLCLTNHLTDRSPPTHLGRTLDPRPRWRL